MDERSALLYAKLHSYTRLVNRTHGFIRWALARVRTPYVACSFGKDSAVMLHMVLEHAPDIPVIFVRRTETDLIDNYQDVIKQWGDINLTEITFKGWLEDPNAGRTIASATATLENDSYFCGLRADESVGRRLSLKTHGKFYIGSQKIRICPLADFTTRDIAAYIISNKLPTLNTYKNNGFEVRTTSGVPKIFARETLARIKQSNIEAYNQLLKILPDVKTFI